MSTLNNQFAKLAFIKKNSLIHHNCSDDTLTVIVRRVQKTKIEPILGTPFYKELLAAVTTGVTPAQKTLLDDYLIPTLLGYCEYFAAKFYNVEIRNKNTGKANDEHTTAATDEENSMFRQELHDMAKIYEQTLIGYLKDNKETFPKYCEWSDLCEDVQAKPEQDSFDTSFSIISK